MGRGFMNIHPNRGVRDRLLQGNSLHFVFRAELAISRPALLVRVAELANTSGVVILDCPPVTSTEPSFSRVAV